MLGSLQSTFPYHTPSYHIVSPRKIISDAHVELLRFGSNPALREYAGADAAQACAPAAAPQPGTPHTHKIYHWDYVHPDGTLFKGGWGGQGLIVNPEQDLVVVFASYFKDGDYSEVDLSEKIFEVLNGVFGVATPL